jgi:4-amino-4-deoxy-L-arabinose transferase-like glycosyltransferase
LLRAGGASTSKTGGTAAERARRRRWVVGILALAGGLRLTWAIYAAREPLALLSGDPFSYFHYGQEIAAGRGYLSYAFDFAGGDSGGSGPVATAYFPVGYPAVLGGLFWLVQHTPIPDDLPTAGAVFQAALGTASVGLTFVIVERLFGGATALVASVLMAVMPNLVFYTATFNLETTFILLLLAALYVLVTHDWGAGPPSRARMSAFGAVLGASVLVRPFSLPFLAAAAVALTVAYGWRSAATAIGWATLILVAVLTPWTVRNAVAMHAFVPFSTNLGDTACLDRAPDATGAFRWECLEGFEDVPPAKLEVRRNQVNLRRSINFVVRHPGSELTAIPRRARITFQHDHDGLDNIESLGHDRFLGTTLRRVLRVTSNALFFVTLPLAIVGLVAFFRDRRPDRLLVGLAALSLLALPLVLYGNPRFHVPLLPFQAMAAAVTMTAAASWLARHRPLRPPLVVPHP